MRTTASALDEQRSVSSYSWTSHRSLLRLTRVRSIHCFNAFKRFGKPLQNISIKWNSVLAHLPVHFQMQNSEGSSDAVSIYNNCSRTKSDTIKRLPECIEHSLKPSATVAVSGLPAITANGYRMKLYFFSLRTLQTFLKRRRLKVIAWFPNRKAFSYLFW